jgi:hypothetical protein
MRNGNGNRRIATATRVSTGQSKAKEQRLSFPRDFPSAQPGRDLGDRPEAYLAL